MTAVEERPIGFGRLKRKEDPRFIRGQGRYLDDITLPGMLHGAVLRSPVAHARITSIDTTEALAHPKVHAVITGADLEPLNLAWAPTLSADVQAVLATDKVRFQGQEVAFVVADDHYSARDALELIDVDYELLPPVVDARTALDPDAPVIRDDLEGRTDNHIFDWEAGDAAECDAVFERADVVVAEDIVYPRVHPAPMETCGAVADYDKVSGKLTLYETTQAPHAHRTLYALVAGIAEHKIRVISPDIGGGFGNKVGIYPGYVCSIVGSIVTGRPVKWMEDRSENLMSHLLRPRLPHAWRGGGDPGREDPCRPGTTVLADHGAFNAHRPADGVPGRLLRRLHRLLRPGGRALRGHRRLHQQGVRAAWPTPARSAITEAVYLIERMVDVVAHGPRASTRRSCGGATSCAPSSSPTRPRPAGCTTPATTPRTLQVALDKAGYDELRSRAGRPAPPVRGRRAREAHGHRAVASSPRRSEPVPDGTMDIIGPRHGRRRRTAGAPHGEGGRCASRCRRQGQGHETTFAQIVGEGARDLRPTTSRWCTATATRRRSGSGPTASRSTPVSGGGGRRWWRARSARRAKIDGRPSMLEASRWTTWSGTRPAAGRSPATPTPRKVDGRDRDGLALQSSSCPRASRATWTPRCVTYNPPNLTYPVRRLHLPWSTSTPGHGDRGRAPLHRGRRLRRADQPDDRRGAGPRRARGRRGDGAHAGHRRSI